MLRVLYEAVRDLEPGRQVEIRETRATLNIRIRAGSRPAEYVSPLNDAFDQLLKQCSWFQVWRGRIISADSPGCPLTVRFVQDWQVDLRTCVQIREHQGDVRVHVCPVVPAELLVRAMNPAVEEFLAGGQWFQLWQGEIVTMDASQRGAA